MEKRELGINELKERLESIWNTYGLKDVILLPSQKITIDNIPCLLMHVGEDIIVKTSTRNGIGYAPNAPSWRMLTIVVECWELSYENVINLYKEARKTALKDYSGILVESVNIKEAKADGPFIAAEVAEQAYGMRLFLQMGYPDEGPDFS